VTKAAFSPVAITNATSTGTTSSIGRRVARRSSPTWSRCVGFTTARCTKRLERSPRRRRGGSPLAHESMLACATH
jgi:hypothetical protein